MEIAERDEVGPYLLEIEVSTQPSITALRLSHAVLHAFGPIIGRLLTGGGLEVDGRRYSVAEIVAEPELWEAAARSVIEVIDALDPAELQALAVRMLAGCTRFRVTRDPDIRTPGQAPGDPGVPTEWTDVADDEHATEVVEDLFPTLRHLMIAVFRSASMNVRPTSPAADTSGGSKAAKTPRSRAGTKSTKRKRS